jgi:TonB-linked SusC/RagA family outer membrane protein
MKKILLFLVCVIGMCVGSLWAQTQEVSGTVTEAGAPLAGASVAVKGTAQVVLTDAEGRYSITVPEHATLVVSFVGLCTQEVEVGHRQVLNVAMDAAAIRLDDLVVVGYGSARKIASTVGSVARVSSEQIAAKPVANVMDAMQGRVSGLQVFNSSGEPSSVPTMRLHGLGSIGSGNEPLYLIDGVPMMADAILALNANDFESIAVLKDASATSIYGARAANGVLYITTKQGSLGAAAITARVQYGVSMLARGDAAFNVMNAKELLDLQLEYGINHIDRERYDQLLASGVDTKWYRYFFKNNVPTVEGDVAIRGGNEKMKYYLSGSYFDQLGLTLHSGYERYALRANVDATPRTWLRTGLHLAGAYATTVLDGYTYQGSSNPNSLTAQAYRNQPYYSPYDENGNEKDYLEDVGNYNAFYAERVQSDVTNTVSVTGNLYVEIKPCRGLTARSQLGLDFRDVRRSYALQPSSLIAKNNGMVREDFARYPVLTVTNTLEYKFHLAPEHDFTLLAGHEGIQNTSSDFSMLTEGQTDDRLLLLSTGTKKGDPRHNVVRYAYLSFFGMLNYAWKDRYFIDLSLRNDASSRFGKSRRNAVFYSAGVLWNAKKEAFLADHRTISELSAKVSFGTTGNSDIPNYQHLATIGTARYDGQATWALHSPGNARLGWETQQLLTAGVKVELFGRLRAEVDWYHRQTMDMLMDVPYPYTSGWASVPVNMGSMRNTGIDLTLGATLVKNDDWTVEANATLNCNRNRVTALFHGLTEWVASDALIGFVVGQPVSFYLPVYADVNPANGRQLWKVPGTDERTETFVQTRLAQMTDKPMIPVWSGGVELSAAWRGIYASAFCSWIGEKYMINNDRFFYENSTFLQVGYNQSKTMMNMWRRPGDRTSIPRFGEAAQVDTHLLENASFLRLKNLTVGYAFPKSLLANTHFFDGAKVYFTARNLFTVTAFTGPDPEIDSNLARYAYPSTKQFMVGLELAF